jgi:hypothetical protein
MSSIMPYTRPTSQHPWKNAENWSLRMFFTGPHHTASSKTARMLVKQPTVTCDRIIRMRVLVLISNITKDS